MLGKKRHRIPKIQSTELKMVNKLKCPSEDSSVLLGREKIAFTRGDGERGTWKGKWTGWGGRGRGEGNLIWYWVREKN